MNRRTLLCGLAALLAGCGGRSDEPRSATPPPATASRTPTLRVLTGTPTDSPTRTATASPTPTATPTSTPTPTPTPPARTTPAPSEVTVARDAWATVQTGGTEFGVRVAGYLVRDDLPGVGRPPDADERWVDVRTQVRNTGETSLTLSWRQWALEDIAGTRVAPDAKAMRNVTDAMPREFTLGPLDGLRSRVVFATENPRGGVVLVEPYRTATGPTVRIVPD